MAGHRGLVITLVIAVVVAVVGVGVLAWSSNDTDESVQEEVAASYLGRNVAADATPAPGSSGGRASMTVVVFCEKDGVTCKGKLIPLWDAWNNCVEEDYTREQTFNFRNTTPSSYASLDLGVTDKCFGEHSQMRWRTARDDGAHADVELHVDSFTGTVHAECGGLLRGTCKKHDKSATQLMVVFS